MRRYWLFLVLVVILAFVLRFYKVTSVPPSLNWDEISIGYNAYSVLETGRDEWGQLLPLHFKSFGEYKLPGQIYASIPAVAIFGLNPLAVRVTPVIYGTLTVLLLYFLAYELFRKRSIALISAFFMAVSPWHIQLTRASFESSFALMWVVLGILLLVKGFKRNVYWLLSVFPFAFAVYTYNSERIFIPLFLLAIAIIYRKEFLKNLKVSISALIVLMVLLLPVVSFFISGEGAARYKLVSITDEAGLIPRIEEKRNSSNLPDVLVPLVYNRPTYLSIYFTRNYLAHFTPAFLFLTGASHHQHHVQGIGELYLIQAPFLFYGIYLLIKKKHKYFWLLASWLLISFVPAALTMDSIPHALRTLIAVPVYQIFTAYGLYYVFLYFKNKSKVQAGIFVLFVVVLFVAQFAGYLRNYYKIYPVEYSRDWQYGYSEAVTYIKEHLSDYDLVVFSREYGEPHIFTLFYLQYDPNKFINSENLERFETYDWVRVLRFDKFYFPDLGDEGTMVADVIGENEGKKILFIGTPDEIPDDMMVKRIDFLNGQPAFEIGEKI